MKKNQTSCRNTSVSELLNAGSEEERIVAGLKRFGRRAYNETLKQGGEATVLRGNKICRVNGRGDVSVIEELGQTRYRVTQNTYKLK